MQAMILAAGFGTRLLPYTKIRPKPLFPLLNTPLLLLTIEQLQKSGFSHIIINCHHLREQIVDAVSGVSGVTIQQETSILGTGGGLRKALSVMSDEPLLITNGDIYHTIDFTSLYEAHTRSARKVTLAVHDYPRFNTMIIKDSKLQSFTEPGEKGGVAFTGIHVIQPEVLEQIDDGEKSCIIDRYRALVKDDHEAIGLEYIDGEYWTDMGTPEDYLLLHQGLLLGEIPLWPRLEKGSRSPVLISDGATFGRDVDLNGWACIGNARIGSNVTITRSVVWDGAVVPDNAVVKDTVIAK